MMLSRINNYFLELQNAIRKLVSIKKQIFTLYQQIIKTEKIIYLPLSSLYRRIQ